MNSGSIDTPRCLVHSPSRDNAIAGDLGERNENKGALEKPRMRQRQIGLIQGQVVVAENIDICGAGAVAFFVSPIATQCELDFLRACKKFAWAQ